MSKCKKGNLKCSLGFETKNKAIKNKYDSDYICNPNEHGWSFIPDVDFFNKVDFIKKCDDPNNPKVSNNEKDQNIKNDYGYRYMMSNGKLDPSMEDTFTYPEKPIRYSCIRCKPKKGGYKKYIKSQKKNNNMRMSRRLSKRETHFTRIR